MFGLRKLVFLGLVGAAIWFVVSPQSGLSRFEGDWVHQQAFVEARLNVAFERDGDNTYAIIRHTLGPVTNTERVSVVLDENDLRVANSRLDVVLMSLENDGSLLRHVGVSWSRPER